MFTAFLALVLGLSQSPTSPPPAAPQTAKAADSDRLVLPLGARPEFHQLVRAIEETLAKGNVSEAAKMADNLPKPEFTIGWDESALPANLKPDVDAMRDLVIKSWEHIPNVHLHIAATGDLNISFVKELPKDRAGLPMASQLAFGINPRLNVQIGLTRGNPGQSIIPNDAYMEIGHAIGAFLGNSDDSLPGNCMYRNNAPALRVYGVNQTNWQLAGENLTVSDQIRAQVKANHTVQIVDGQLDLSPKEVEMGTLKQGLRVPLDFKITNHGTGPLNYNLVPDCSCFTRVAPGVVAPGQETTIRTLVNTASYVGEVHKLLVLYTNDPQTPVQEIPVTFLSAPPCHLYRPQGDTVILPIANDSVDILLTIPTGSKIKPTQYDWNGMDAKVVMEPWTGTVSDELLQEPSKPRQGYIFHVKLGKSQINGRSSGTLIIQTDDEAFPQFSYTLNAQRGILASPKELYLGELAAVNRGSFFVSRPGKPFKILSVDAGAKSLTAAINPSANGTEYRIDVIYDGSAPKGDFFAEVTIHTSDPSQPTLLVTVRGTVL